MTDSDGALDLLADLIRRARRAGADAADAVLVGSAAISHARRLGKLEKLERAESRDLGLRVLVGRRQAIVATNDTDAKALDELVARAVAMARVVPEDPFCGLADPDQIFKGKPLDLDLNDAVEPATERLIELAQAAEDAAMAVKGVTNSEGAEAGWSRSSVSMAASNGFAGSYAVSRHSLSVSVLAGEGTGMERDYDFSSVVHGADLDDAARLGKAAGERAVKRLNPRKVKTVSAPIVYDRRIAGGLIGHLSGAISGPAIARGTSFLKDRLGQAVFAPGVTITDDPHRRRGLRSKPFDGEGIANAKRAIVERGVLTTWLLDLRSARQLDMATTGHAARGIGGPPSPAPSNLYLEPGPLTPDQLMADIKEGFLVTELMGSGVNGVTGDYSRGATGFWIENGRPAYPVSEVTIAGNLKEMYPRLTPANDLQFRYGTDAPTLRVEGMTVAGK
ncbi:MAG: TldD/PmbA family protein [Alphaproteobacteria bacterium]|nr:TldD/PmbA family protein [Alphaproteobacteria bacterium]